MAQQLAHGVQAVGVGHLIKALLDQKLIGLGRGDFYALRAAHELVGQLLDSFWVSGREQQGLALGRALLGHLHDVVKKAHVQHAVGFVQHQGVQAFQRQVAALQVVHDAAGRAHHHMGAML